MTGVECGNFFTIEGIHVDEVMGMAELYHGVMDNTTAFLFVMDSEAVRVKAYLTWLVVCFRFYDIPIRL